MSACGSGRFRFRFRFVDGSEWRHRRAPLANEGEQNWKAALHLMAPVTQNHEARLHGGLVHSVITQTSATAASTSQFRRIRGKASRQKKNLHQHTRLLIKVQNNPHWMTGVMWRRNTLRCKPSRIGKHHACFHPCLRLSRRLWSTPRVILTTRNTLGGFWCKIVGHFDLANAEG